MKKKDQKLLGKFIRLDQSGRDKYRSENEFDATKPSVLIVLTISYIAIVFFLILGVPWQGQERTPIPPEDLPVALTIFALLYVVIVGGFYLRDKLRK